MKRFLAATLSVTLVVGVFAYEPTQVQASTTDVFTTNGTWTAPAGVTVVQVNAWGGGAQGGTVVVGNPKGGGGGGAYSALNAFSVTPGNVYVVSVGQGGTGGVVAGDSMFSASSTLLAKGGTQAGSAPTGGIGGQASAGVGDVKFSGGNAGNGATASGGGGGGAGTTQDGGVGGNASGATPGTGGIGGTSRGGNGAQGVTSGTGLVGSTLAGGGSGAVTGAGGAGARGEVDITYTPAAIAGPSIFIIKSKMIVRGQFIVK